MRAVTIKAYVSIRQHTSAYVSIRQHTSALYVSIRQHTSALYLAYIIYIVHLYARCDDVEELVRRILTYADVC